MRQSKYTYVWVSLVILVFGIIVIPRIVERIRDGAVVEHDRMNQEKQESLAYILLDGKRRKVPDFAFLNQDSLLITNEDFSGKVYVAEFFFTSCPTICPVMNRNLVAIQNELREFEDFGVASFTINPQHDTPGVLKAYSEEYGITDMDWHLMTGDADKIMALANTGFNIYASPDAGVPGGFEHSGMFALIDRQGFLRSRKDSYGNPLIYYNGAIDYTQGKDREGREEEIGILMEDIKKLLAE